MKVKIICHHDGSEHLREGDNPTRVIETFQHELRKRGLCDGVTWQMQA